MEALQQGGWLKGGFGILLGLILGMGGLTFFNQTQPAPIYIATPAPTATFAPTATPSPITVFVNGAVIQEGVYEFANDSRIQDAIERAGGFAPTADQAVVNLAFPLSDGMQVYVPTEGEEVSAPIITGADPTTTSNPESGQADALININTATSEQLETLPGIGPSTAQNIINHREENGLFASIENIMDVSGIGEGRFEQIQALITVGE